MVICDPAFLNESDGYWATFSLWPIFQGRLKKKKKKKGFSNIRLPSLFCIRHYAPYVSFVFINVIEMCFTHATACW